MRRQTLLALALLFTSSASFAQAPPRAPLRVVSAGPTGEIAAGAEVNEIRVVFSESMTPLGRVLARLRPSFFHVAPAISGTFRWSGTTILIFTPTRKLPLATAYTVTIDATAASLSGRTLERPYTFTFTTPPVRLLQTNWYRPGGRYDAAPIVALRFNQPVRAQDVVSHLLVQLEPHTFEAPRLQPEVEARLRAANPAAVQAFAQKVATAAAAAGARSPVSFHPASTWDEKRFPRSADLIVLELTTPVPPESWVRVQTDGAVPSPAGPAVSRVPEHFTIEVERAFFVDDVHCVSECDPDTFNPVEFRTPVKAERFAAALTAKDITDPAREQVQPKGTPRRQTWQKDEAQGLTVEDAGFKAQPPASRWLLALPADFEAADGQPRLRLGGHRRQLAPAGVYELW